MPKYAAWFDRHTSDPAAPPRLRKDNPGQQNIAQPVGGNTEREIRVIVLPDNPSREYKR